MPAPECGLKLCPRGSTGTGTNTRPGTGCQARTRTGSQARTRAGCALDAAQSSSCQGVNTLGPSAVIATVNSKWAARDPSCE